ncbi:MAG: Ig-like domain-containing protein [Chloroflexi bacterium]|nr:Ig-like domain-containing protein [Chloroflexota bacterium]
MATINATSGLAASLNVGSTVITATSGAISGSTTLTVTAPVLLSIVVAPAAATVGLGQTQQFTATGTYTNGTADITTSVSWSSSNPSVATINNAGVATAKAAGTTLITASLGGIVSPPATLTVVVPTTVEVNNGNTITLGPGQVITGSSTGGIPVDVKNVVTAAEGLAAFDFTLNWNPAVIRVDRVRASLAASDLGWAFTIGAINNTTGTVSFVGTTTQQPYSKANITLAYLGITATGNVGDNTTITVTIKNLVDNALQEITPRSPVNAPVVLGVNLVAETGISQSVNATSGVSMVKVNINRIKNSADNSTASMLIGSYTATVSSNASSSIQFLAVNGVSPYGNPTFDNVTGIFSLATVSAPTQANNTTVANVVPILTGNATTRVSLILAFQYIGSADQPGLSVPEEHANSINLLRGDADNSGVISVTDSLALKQYLVGQLTLSQINPINAASPNHDGTAGDKITITDALAIEQFLVKQLNAYFK